MPRFFRIIILSLFSLLSTHCIAPPQTNVPIVQDPTPIDPNVASQIDKSIGLVGGTLGRNMNLSDQKLAYQALNSTPNNRTFAWRNTSTGIAFSVMPISNITYAGNKNCREYKTTVTISEKERHVYATACLQANGTWIDIN